MIPLNRESAERFLTALDPDGMGRDAVGSFWTFQTFDDDAGRKSKNLVRVLHGTLDEHWDTLARLNDRGAGVFVTVNETDGKGRSAENIVKVRALFVDLDGAPLPRFGPASHIIVQTSPGHWHVYWRVYWKHEGADLKEFRDKQRALIAAHGGDPAICDLPRVMRLPGFFHRKAKPTLVSLISTSFHLPYPSGTFETLQTAPRQANAKLTADEGRIARALAFVPNVDVDWKEWCDFGLAIYVATGGADTGFAMFDAWSQRSAAKYNARQTEKTWAGFERSPPNRIGVGTIIFKARQAVPKWADLLDDRDPEAVALVKAFIKSIGGA